MKKTSASLPGVVAIVTAISCALGARPCRAAGFLIYDISGSAMARASAVTADDEEPAAVWFNPANLAFMGGVSASAGGVFITDRTTFSPSGGGPETSTERGNFLLPEFFANGRITDRVALGMGVYSTFGIGITWPYDWEGREAAIKASLETLTLNPTVAVLVHPQISVAAGFDAVRSVVDFTNGLPTIIGGDVRLAGGTWGYGFNVGALYKSRLAGCTWRSPTGAGWRCTSTTGGRTSPPPTPTSRRCCPTRAERPRLRSPTSSPSA